jgi:hypothetical protein
MSKQIVLTLSNEFYQQVQIWAAITRQNLEEALSDEEVLKRCRLEMDPGQALQLGRLLEKQRQGTLTTEERRELESLIYVRNQLWIRRSEAQEEAERRGLRVPSPS